MPHITVPDTTPLISYTVTAAQSAFTIPAAWAFFDGATDIRVFHAGTELSYSASPADATQFSVAGVAGADGGFNGGTVTLGATVSSTTIVLQRDVPIARTEDFPYPSPTLNIKALNTALDRIVTWGQQLRSSLARAVRLPDGETDPGMTLPSLANRASKVLGFDANGAPVASTKTLSEIESQADTATSQAQVATQAATDAAADRVQTGLDRTAAEQAASDAQSAASSIADPLPRDGSSPMTGTLDMGGNAITNAAGVAAAGDNNDITSLGALTRTTVTIYTSGSNTYTSSANCREIRVRLVGGGASGSGGSFTGNAGGNTTFGTMTGGGGSPSGVALGTNQFGGAGGAASGGNILNIYGQRGGGTNGNGGNGGGGGSSQLGNGAADTPGGGNNGLTPDANNYGAGGAGASNGVAATPGSGGGGGGGYCESRLAAGSYAYSVGAGGAASGSPAGGAGASGCIIIEEYH